jgi:alpha-ribazole phosphatase
MNIYLVRHTKPSVKQGICYGHSNVDVASSFVTEADCIAERLKKIQFKLLYSSPLLRCKKLAERLTLNPEAIIYDARLKELNFGYWEGKLWSEFEQTPETLTWFADYLNVSCPGGESYLELLIRVRDFLNDIVKPSDENILIISHTGPIRSIYSILSGIDPKEALMLKIDYGEILEIRDINQV